MPLQLTGIHHLTAITANAAENLRFYTQVLGLRLVKKTVNQDDTSAYHLFYADGLASPGSDLTFFDWPVGHERRGTHSVSRTGLRIATLATLEWWKARLAEEKVKADYDVAKEKCDDMQGDAKNACQKEAKAAEAKGKADIKAMKKM